MTTQMTFEATVLRIKFMAALDNENYRLAQLFLARAIEYHMANGYNSATECIEFEMIVKWFDKNVVEAGLIETNGEEVMI